MTDTPTPPEPAIYMTPGRYMRLRREAAGLTFQHIAIVVVPASRRRAPEDREDVRRNLALLEENRLGGAPQAKLIGLLASVFSFDAAVYWQLVARAADPESELPVPQICRGCGCTWNDPCPDGDDGCGWSPLDSTLCTVCARKQPANDIGRDDDAA